MAVGVLITVALGVLGMYFGLVPEWRRIRPDEWALVADVNNMQTYVNTRRAARAKNGMVVALVRSALSVERSARSSVERKPCFLQQATAFDCPTAAGIYKSIVLSRLETDCNGEPVFPAETPISFEIINPGTVGDEIRTAACYIGNHEQTNVALLPAYYFPGGTASVQDFRDLFERPQKPVVVGTVQVSNQDKEVYWDMASREWFFSFAAGRMAGSAITAEEAMRNARRRAFSH